EMQGASCTTATINTYAGTTCDIGTNTFSFTSLLTYATAGIGNIPISSEVTVVPSGGSTDPSLDFTGTFSSGAIAGSQTDIVHFAITALAPILSVTFSLDSPIATNGILGTAAVAGTELICIGGTFTSLPVGVVSNLVAPGSFGCGGTVLQIDPFGIGVGALL